jgi:hypothetical protein
MFASRFLPIVFAMVLSGTAVAQQVPAPATDAAPGAAATMPLECKKDMSRHDHGAEKGTPTPKMTGCAMKESTAPSAKTKAKAKLGHDHARTHKLM